MSDHGVLCCWQSAASSGLLSIHGSSSSSPGTASSRLPLNERGRMLPVTSHVAVPAVTNTGLCPQSRHLTVYNRQAAPPLLSNTQTASWIITERKGSRLTVALIWTMEYLTPGNMLYALSVWRSTGRPSRSTDCITSYRRSLLPMSLAATAVPIVRDDPTKHRRSKTSTTTAVAVLIRWKLSTVVAMSVSMIVTRKVCDLACVAGFWIHIQQTRGSAIAEEPCDALRQLKYYGRFLTELLTRSSANPEEPCEHNVSWNRVQCCTNVRRIACENVCNRWMTFKLIQGHCHCHHLIGHILFHISLPL